MKIFALIRNYGEGSGGESLWGEGGVDWYEMPDSSIVRSGNPVFLPDFAERYEAYPSIVYRIGRLGKSIKPRFADRYVDQWGIAVAMVAVDLLQELREGGHPWTRAVAYDRSCMLGNLEPIDTLKDIEGIRIEAGEESLDYHRDQIREGIDEVIARLSAHNTLKNGDFVLVALPRQGLLLKEETRLSAYPIEDNQRHLIDINIK